MEENDKKAFFDELYQLDDESAGPEDESNVSVILAQSKLPDNRRGKSRALHSNRSLGRTVSAPIVPASVSFPASSSQGQITRNPADVSKIEAAKSLATNDLSKAVSIQASISNKSSKKRKRGLSFDALPDSQQIFKGLSFFFFPNNDVSPARGFRIRKAMEWGAIWIKTWKGGITHVVVDRSLSHRDLLNFLKFQSLPREIVLVNEDYPPDCIRFRCVVNPRQPQYRVAGDEDLKDTFPSRLPTTSRGTPFPLKPDHDEIARLLQTPSRTDRSTAEMSAGSLEQCHTDPEVTHVPDSVPSSLGQYPQDALSEAIKHAQTARGLPIDLDEDDNASRETASDDSEDDHNSKDRQARNKPKNSFTKTWQQNFTCMERHPGMDTFENPNTRTIEILQQMADYYDRVKDHWRTIGYRKAISALKKQRRKIATAEEAFAIPFIGRRLAEKIEEIVCTNHLRRLDNTNVDAIDEVLQLFLKIYGVGHVQACKWIEQGHRNINDLLNKVDLTKNQKIGIEHLDDFQTRIPRQEMDQHLEYIRKTIRKIDPNVQVIIGGSYRRGARDCGDIDIIVTKPNCALEVVRTIMVGTIIPHFFTKGYLKVGLATTQRDDGGKWHGAAVLPGNILWRRIDFLFVPWNELGAALLYFTGNDIFNRSIRLLASKKGMRLNQRGLWKDVMRGKDRERVTQGSLVEGKDEKRIFELLGVPWRPPEHRIC